MSKKNSSSSVRWLQRQRRDPYVKSARAQGYRSRAAYKLIELDDRDHILQRGLVVVDLGAAPGGWSQIVSERIGATGQLIMVDVLPMEPVPGADVIQGDLNDALTMGRVTTLLAGRKADLVISDMAPNTTGIRSVDQARSLELAETAQRFAADVLATGGALVVKVFQSPDVEQYMIDLRKLFRCVTVRKPGASRSQSGELYMIAKSYGL